MRNPRTCVNMCTEYKYSKPKKHSLSLKCQQLNCLIWYILSLPKWEDKEWTPHELCLQQYDHYISNCESGRHQTVRPQQICPKWQLRDLIWLFSGFMLFNATIRRMRTVFQKPSYTLYFWASHFVRAPPTGTLGKHNFFRWLRLWIIGTCQMKGDIATSFLILAGPPLHPRPHPCQSSFPLRSLAKCSKSEIYGRDIGEFRI